MQYIQVMIKREVLIKDTFRTSSANQESSSKKNPQVAIKGTKKISSPWQVIKVY